MRNLPNFYRKAFSVKLYFSGNIEPSSLYTIQKHLYNFMGQSENQVAQLRSDSMPCIQFWLERIAE